MSAASGLSLDQYRTQAKDLLKKTRADDPEAVARIRNYHPQIDRARSLDTLRLVDCQLVIARELGYSSWTRLKQDLIYRNAVAAIDSGDNLQLARLLTDSPGLVAARRRLGEWYETGYFEGAMLLHHVAGNPIRHKLPVNIADIARTLLNRSADPNAKTLGGASTIELLLSSRQASEAGVALPLVDLLRSAGATDDLDAKDLLSSPLLNQAPATAAELAERGAKMDVRHAAGLGRLDLVEQFLATERDARILNEALAFACVRSQEEAAQVLVRHGIRGDVLVSHGGRSPCTALHEAANRGHTAIVKLLLDNGADGSVVEPAWGGTPAGWAAHGRHPEIADLLNRHLRTK